MVLCSLRDSELAYTGSFIYLFKMFVVVILMCIMSTTAFRRTSTRARTILGRVAEANYVISAFCPRQTRKNVRIIVPFVLTAGVS